MKKLLLVAVAGVFVLASCKKDYTCTCTFSGDFAGTPATSTTLHAKKADAKTACEAGTNTAYGVTCAIK